MGYVNNNLMEGESIVHEAKVHWIVYFDFVFWMLLYYMFYRLADYLTPDYFDKPFYIDLVIIISVLLMFSCLFMCIASFIEAWVARFSTELAVTTFRVMAKFGFIKRKTVELNLIKVESFTIDQSVLGRLLGYGTLTINGTGGIRAPIPYVDDPLEFRRQAVQETDNRANHHD